MTHKTIRLKSTIYEKIKKESTRSGFPMSIIFGRSIENYLKDLDINNSNRYLKTVQIKELGFEIKQLLSSGFIIINIKPNRVKGILFNIEYINK